MMQESDDGDSHERPVPISERISAFQALSNPAGLGGSTSPSGATAGRGRKTSHTSSFGGGGSDGGSIKGGSGLGGSVGAGGSSKPTSPIAGPSNPLTSGGNKPGPGTLPATMPLFPNQVSSDTSPVAKKSHGNGSGSQSTSKFSSVEVNPSGNTTTSQSSSPNKSSGSSVKRLSIQTKVPFETGITPSPSPPPSSRSPRPLSAGSGRGANSSTSATMSKPATISLDAEDSPTSEKDLEALSFVAPVIPPNKEAPQTNRDPSPAIGSGSPERSSSPQVAGPVPYTPRQPPKPYRRNSNSAFNSPASSVPPSPAPSSPVLSYKPYTRKASFPTSPPPGSPARLPLSPPPSSTSLSFNLNSPPNGVSPNSPPQPLPYKPRVPRSSSSNPDLKKGILGQFYSRSGRSGSLQSVSSISEEDAEFARAGITNGDLMGLSSPTALGFPSGIGGQGRRIASSPARSPLVTGFAESNNNFAAPNSEGVKGTPYWNGKVVVQPPSPSISAGGLKGNTGGGGASRFKSLMKVFEEEDVSGIPKSRNIPEENLGVMEEEEEESDYPTSFSSVSARWKDRTTAGVDDRDGQGGMGKSGGLPSTGLPRPAPPIPGKRSTSPIRPEMAAMSSYQRGPIGGPALPRRPSVNSVSSSSSYTPSLSPNRASSEQPPILPRRPSPSNSRANLIQSPPMSPPWTAGGDSSSTSYDSRSARSSSITSVDSASTATTSLTHSNFPIKPSDVKRGGGKAAPPIPTRPTAANSISSVSSNASSSRHGHSRHRDDGFQSVDLSSTESSEPTLEGLSISIDAEGSSGKGKGRLSSPTTPHATSNSGWISTQDRISRWDSGITDSSASSSTSASPSRSVRTAHPYGPSSSSGMMSPPMTSPPRSTSPVRVPGSSSSSVMSSSSASTSGLVQSSSSFASSSKVPLPAPPLPPLQSNQGGPRKIRPIDPRARTRYFELFDRNVVAAVASHPPNEPSGDEVVTPSKWKGKGKAREVVDDDDDEPLGVLGGKKGKRMSALMVMTIWNRSKLDKGFLKDLWDQCDRDRQGSLDRIAFSEGMWRIDEKLRQYAAMAGWQKWPSGLA